MRERMFSNLEIIRSDRVLVMNSGHGLLVWEAYRHTPEGLVVAQVRNSEESAYIQQYMKTLDPVSAPKLVLDPDYGRFLSNLDQSVEQDIRFEHILGRNILTDSAKAKAILTAMKDRLVKNGDIVLCETIVSEASRLSDFIHMGPLQDTLLKAEKKIYSKVQTRDDLLNMLKSQFNSVSAQDYRFTESRTVRESDIQRWVRNSYIPALKDLSQTEAEKLEKELVSTLCAAPLMWKTSCLIVSLKCN